MGDVVGDPLVVDDAALADAGGQNQTVEALAAAQRHIDLSGGKGESGVDDSMLKGQALALMDGDGPGQAQGILLEGTCNLGFYGLGLGVDGVFGILPLIRLHLDSVFVARTEHGDGLLVDGDDMSDTAVVILVLA